MKLNLSSYFLILIVCQGLIYLGQSQCLLSDMFGCKKCKENYYLGNYEGYRTCYACPNGWISPEGSISNGDCYKCTDDGCKYCSPYTVDKCPTCKPGYYLSNNKCIACADGYSSVVGSTSAAACAPCLEGCDKCIDPTWAGNCITCKENYYLATVLVSQCVFCGEGFSSPKGSVGAQSCAACDPGCKTCSGTDAGQCLECKENYFMQNGVCVACSQGQTSAAGSVGAASCFNCPIDGCQLCSADNQCGTCEGGTYLDNNKCVSCGIGNSSPKGSTSVDACVPCDVSANCLTCSSPEPRTCTSCKPGWHMRVENDCVSCSGSFWWDKCTKCTADNKCAACEYPLFVNTDGNCDSCVAGYYADSKTTKAKNCKKCEDSNCDECTGAGTGKCTSCSGSGPFYYLEGGKCKGCGPAQYLPTPGPWTSNACTDCPQGCSECFGSSINVYCSSCSAGFYLDENSWRCLQCPVGYSGPPGATNPSQCFKCADNDCEHCSGQETGQCTSCAQDFYLSRGKCVACPDGGFSAPGSTSKEACGACYDSNCYHCNGWPKGYCLQCNAGYYLKNDYMDCYACGEGRSSPVGSQFESSCFDCDDDGCAFCLDHGIGQCSRCKDSFYLADDKTCKACDDENCAVCTGTNIGRCTSCHSGFKLVSGTCKVPGEALNTNNLVSATIRYDLTMTQFNNEGGKNYFIAKTSRLLGVDIEQVTVSSVRQGSVIVDYEVSLSGDNTAAQNMKDTMDAAVPAGQMEFFTSGKVLNYDSKVGPRDTGNDTGSGSKMGIIVGAAAGVVCVVIALVIWKKISMMKAKKRAGSMNVKNKNNKVVAVDESAEKTFKVEAVA